MVVAVWLVLFIL